MSFEIQRHSPSHAEANPDGWVRAFGLNRRSYIMASGDDDAIAAFKERTRRTRSPYRLVKYGGLGYGVRISVIATNGVVPRVVTTCT